MTLNKQMTAMSLLIMAALSVAIGCGDGKHKKTRTNRGALANKTTPGQPGTMPIGGNKTGMNNPPPLGQQGGTNVPGGTGGRPGQAGGNGGLPLTQDNKAKTSRIQAIKQEYMEKGSPITSLQQLEEGTYTLESTMSWVQIYPGGSANVIEAIGVFQVDPATRALVADQQQREAYGVAQEQDPGRKMEISGQFQVKQPFSGPRREENPWFYETRLDISDAGNPQMKDTTGQAQAANSTISLADIMAGRTIDVNGKTLNVSYLKTADARLRVVVNVDEFLVSANKNANRDSRNPQMLRAMVFTYSFKPDATKTQQPANDNSTAPAQNSNPEGLASEMKD